jgi:hypothetical protein
MSINYARAKKLCSDAEMRLVDDARKKHVAKCSEAQLKQRIKRAKKLRDKWKDKSRDQRRQEQKKQGARGVSASGRSQSKADLFGQVLECFQQHLANHSNAAGRGKADGKKQSRAKSSRDQTKAKRSAKQGSPKKTAPKKKKSVPKKVVSKSLTSMKSISNPDSFAEKKPEKKKQIKVQAVAKKARVKKSGLTSRIRGHVSARTRRSQGRRDLELLPSEPSGRDYHLPDVVGEVAKGIVA